MCFITIGLDILCVYLVVVVEDETKYISLKLYWRNYIDNRIKV